jgi:hypothetical protein
MASRESQTANQVANSDNTQPPPTAATAPKGNTAEVFTGVRWCVDNFGKQNSLGDFQNVCLRAL